MSVWSEVRATTTETRRSPSGGRAGRASIITIITATLMLLAGLVSPVGALAPDAPTVVSAIANGQDVTVTFTDNALNGSTVDDYEVTLTATSGGTTTDKTDVGSPITLNNVVPGTYDATVVINSDEGPSDPSAPVEVVVLAPAAAPDAPTVVSAIANGQDVTVTFTDNALNGSTVDDYEVTLTATSGGTTTDKTDVGSPITLNNVVPGTYDATVVINSDEGPSDPSAPVEVVVLAPAAAPAAPTAVSLTPSAGSVVVNFTAGNANGSTITDYTVTMTATANGANKTATVNASGGTVSGVVPGSYSVTVRANSAANGSSPVSAPATTTVPVGQPGLPTGSLVGTAIVASWPAAAAATGYNVELLSGANVVASTSVAGTSATFPNVDPGDYTVRVQATAGAVASAKRTSGEFNVTFRATAVANVSATVNSANTQVTVTWDPPADTGGGVAEYVVSLNPAEAPAQTVQAVNPRTVTFSGLPSGDYTVSVIAVNDGGDSDPGTDTFEIVVAPGAPLNVKTTKPSGVRVATVTWDPPANNGNGTISGYVIKMGGKTKTVGADVRTVSFADLPIGTLTATVQAQNAQGLSAAGSSPEFASERPVHPFESRQAFVQQAFRDLFDRSANAAEQTYWTNLTAPDGSNGANVVEAMMRSELFETRRQISRLYFAYFLRVPDAAGQNYWADLMDRGVIDLQGVSDEFARSAEFVQTYGSLDDAEFVVVVYNNVLLRTPDIVGFNYWLRERQAGLTRGGVMTWFTEGEEFKNLSLSAIDTSLAHITMLDRSPTTSEYRVWVNRINNNASDSLVTLLDAIWNSDEYAARVTPG